MFTFTNRVAVASLLGLTALNEGRPREEIYLLLREQEVSAVEDTALREVALGPDTAQRTRLIQHIVRFGTDALTCEGARDLLAGQWASEGLTPYYDTMRLLSSATLQVSFPSSDRKPKHRRPWPRGIRS